jgi:hypothetical protein
MRHPEDAGHSIAEAITAAIRAAGAVASEAEPKTNSAGVKTLVNQTLGDLLLSGALKHPEDAGRIVAEAITAANGAAKHTEVATKPHPQPAAPEPGANPESPAAADVGPTTPAEAAPALDAKARARPEPGSESPAGAKVVAKPEAGSAVASGTKSGADTLELTTLGELPPAGVIKHPEEAAHIEAGACADAEAPAAKVLN